MPVLFVQAAIICSLCTAPVMVELLFSNDYSHLFHETSNTLGEQNRCILQTENEAKIRCLLVLRTLETVMSKAVNVRFVLKNETVLSKAMFGLFSTPEDVYIFSKAGMLLHCLPFFFFFSKSHTSKLWTA